MATTILQAIDDIDTVVSDLTAQIDTTTLVLSNGLSELASAMRAFRACGCPMGDITEPEDTTEGDPPPEGFTEYDPEIDDRKCKLANMAYDDVLEVTRRLKEMGAENALQMGVGSTTSVVGVVFSLLAAGPLGWGMSVLGSLLGVITFFLTKTIDLDSLITILEDEDVHQDGVQGFYDGSTNAASLANFKAALSAGGASATQLLYIDALKLINGLTSLFFLPDGELGAGINQRLDGYVGEIECVEPVEGAIWFTSPDSPYNEVDEGAFTDNYPSGWLNTGDAYDNADGWRDDTDSSYPDTLFEIENPAYNRPELANNDPEFDRYWVTVRIDFEGYDGAWRFGVGHGFDAQAPSYGPGFSGGYFRSGKGQTLASYIEWVAGLWIVDDYLGVTLGHGGDTNTSNGGIAIRKMTMTVTDDIY